MNKESSFTSCILLNNQLFINIKKLWLCYLVCVFWTTNFWNACPWKLKSINVKLTMTKRYKRSIFWKCKWRFDPRCYCIFIFKIDPSCLLTSKRKFDFSRLTFISRQLVRIYSPNFSWLHKYFVRIEYYKIPRQIKDINHNRIRNHFERYQTLDTYC